MARYTDIDDKKFPKRYEGYTDFARGWNCCLGTILKQPTADVVPKSEVEMLITLNSQLEAKVFEERNAKAEVVREIFEEIEKEIDLALSVITKILNAKGGRANGKTVLLSKYDVFIELKKYIAELKKKYTEEKHEN